MDSRLFILKAALASSTLVPCAAQRAELTVYSLAPQGVPMEHWPEHQERPESPHLPHAEGFLRVAVDSGASVTFTNSSARSTYTTSSPQLAWLRNQLGEKLILSSQDNLR